MLATVYFRDGQTITGDLGWWADDEVSLDGVTYGDWTFMDVPSLEQLAELD